MKKRIVRALALTGMLLLCLSLSGCYIPPDDLSGDVSNLGVGSNNLPFDPVTYTDAPTATPTIEVQQAGAFNPAQTDNVDAPSVNWDNLGSISNPGTTVSNAPQIGVNNNPSIGVTTTRPSIGVTTPNPGTARPSATNTPAPSSLKKGSKGADVKTLQSKLKELGYYSGKVDGDFGEGTEAAVKAFQKRNGLTADGKAGAKTMAKLNSSSAVKAASPTATPKATAKNNAKATAKPKTTAKKTATPTPKKSATATPKPTATPNLTKDYYLQAGSSGAKVKTLQQRLISLGWLVGTPTSKYDGGTEAAVIAFQKKTSGLYDDGVAGPETLKKLYSNGAAKSSTPAASVGIELRYGAEGAAVRALQTRLKALGYLKGSPDGTFGDRTRNALIDFQLNNSLSGDGVASVKTLNKLYSQDALKAGQYTAGSTGNNTNTTLKEGSEGLDVTNLQKRLQKLGYYDGPISGVYNSLTKEAVKVFQKKNGLKADGVAGKSTLELLYSSAAKAEGDMASSFDPLKKGDKGNSVVEMQQVLKRLGYLEEVTGVFDDATYWAVKAFQERNGLKSTGTADSATQVKLYSKNAVKNH